MTKKLDVKMAVEIAKDVIKQLLAERITSTPGVYIEISSSELGNVDFQTAFKKGKIKQCDVCALGSLLIGYVDIEDEMTIKEVDNSGADDIREILKGIFSDNQLTIIERAFEGNMYDATTYSFYRKYDSPTERMIAIMENIIKNKGRFIPSRETLAA